eukprot:TRINITY_DN3893_c0_g1_i6.p1 TRINITY_DN3893_c0_g1~~TRINITY_DN3893_c0_g1_i6.p1  ORF type:complete len:303 (-),score=-7.47 TRINITY_DN3893_c0_g1_i6:37-945(-)
MHSSKLDHFWKKTFIQLYLCSKYSGALNIYSLKSPQGVFLIRGDFKMVKKVWSLKFSQITKQFAYNNKDSKYVLKLENCNVARKATVRIKNNIQKYKLPIQSHLFCKLTKLALTQLLINTFTLKKHKTTYYYLQKNTIISKVQQTITDNHNNLQYIYIQDNHKFIRKQLLLNVYIMYSVQLLLHNLLSRLVVRQPQQSLISQGSLFCGRSEWQQELGYGEEDILYFLLTIDVRAEINPSQNSHVFVVGRQAGSLLGVQEVEGWSYPHSPPLYIFNDSPPRFHNFDCYITKFEVAMAYTIAGG